MGHCSTGMFLFPDILLLDSWTHKNSRMLWSVEERTVHSMIPGCSGGVATIQTQIIKPPPPCLTVGGVCDIRMCPSSSIEFKHLFSGLLCPEEIVSEVFPSSRSSFVLLSSRGFLPQESFLQLLLTSNLHTVFSKGSVLSALNRPGLSWL